jgi:hypothetical protein
MAPADGGPPAPEGPVAEMEGSCTNLPAASKLRLIDDFKRRDHVPLEVNLRYQLEADKQRQAAYMKWDKDLIAEALQEGNRARFGCHRDLQAHFEKHEEEVLEQMQGDSVDEAWNTIVDGIQQSAYRYFGHQHEEKVELQDHRRAVREILQERAQLRAQRHTFQEADYGYMGVVAALKQGRADLRRLERRYWR